ncbi:PREDICTED: uncharacterized protein LOC108759104 [Trachymyrmex cornetzi]|uniref:uncharacterized protein LOC108759104 n=1 Tax=Trachymyrmex cornetzi TaxID=471704 RepID=UPI00084EF2FD|nr:PREDICTED: uncharacterized protein LOC108759104 [Trachymyrmex cornetzi]
MTDRIKFLLQKRTSLKSQTTNLTNALEKRSLDNVTIKLRIARLTKLYHTFEEHHDELVILDPNDAHEEEFTSIQERFYALAGKIENMLNPVNTSSISASSSEAQSIVDEPTVSTKRRRIKLPEAPLPTFDGTFEKWLSFKNTFSSMIGSQTDLSDIDKLHYLKAALIGEAANKIKIFEVDGINYLKAWEILERSYEVKRVLISRHLSLILNLPPLDKETTSGLSKLADDTQQHLASLTTLSVSVGPEIVLHILETKLPRSALDKWEATLERDEFLKLEQMYEFLYKSAVCASRREKSKILDSEKGKGEPSQKKKRMLSSNQAFVSVASRNCVACKVKRHSLYQCNKFRQLPIPKCIEVVRSARVCYNCLRSHRDTPCKFSNCTIRQKRHNTLLHFDKPMNANSSQTPNAEATSSKSA